MLITILRPNEVDGDRLMEIYRESNVENGEYFYPDMDKSDAVARVEREFADFIKIEFLNGGNNKKCWSVRYEFT